jgi:hypothetical protein
MTTKTATKKTPAKPKPEVKKTDLPEIERDWTYLVEKEPSDLHEDLADFICDLTGFEPENKEEFVKAVQMTAVLRMVYQRSDRNKKRSTYRGLPQEIVEQRSVHMVAAHQDARPLIEARKAKEAPKPKPVKPATKATAQPAAKKASAKKAATPRRRPAAQRATPAPKADA